jgi:glycosyltransferase involved in cell wall biosynthesis
MRVLSISTLFPNPARPLFGIFVANSMKALAARGVDLTMINPIGLPPWPLSLREPYKSLARIGPTSDLGGLIVYHPRFTLFPLIGADTNPTRIANAVLPMALRMHAEKPFDLVDAQFFFPDGPAATIVARALGLPLSIKARGADIHYWGDRPKALAQMLTAAHQAKGLLAVAESLARDMRERGFSDRITVHYTGVDHDRFRVVDRAQARAQFPQFAALDGPLLTSTGALIERKGQDFAIEALARGGLERAQLALAGAGEDEARLRAQTARLGVESRVHFLGSVDHERLPLLLAASDAMVLPSASEGLANAWIEALACGTPLVIPDIAGAREVVRDASAGRIVERNADTIALAVCEIVLAAYPQAAVAANASGFSWAQNGEALETYYRTLLA